MSAAPVPLDERLHGILPPVVTPFDADGRFDAVSAERLYRFHLDAGAHGLFLFGSSGEGPLLPDHVLRDALQIAVGVVDGRVPLLAGISAPGSDRAVAKAELARNAGADALVASPPYYYPVTDAEMLAHFRTIRRAVDLPLLVYDIPVMTKCKVSTETALTLAREGTAIGIKDSSGDMVGFRRLLTLRPNGFRMFTGSELFLDAVLLAGADGAVPGLTNAAPEPFLRLYDAWRAGDRDAVARQQRRIVRLFDLFLRPDGTQNFGWVLAAMKAAMFVRGVIECPRTSAPFAPPSDAQIARTRDLLTELELL